jgi:hypothetical protein
MCQLATRKKTPLRLAHCMATKTTKISQIVRDLNRHLQVQRADLLISETNHSEPLLKSHSILKDRDARQTYCKCVSTRSTTRCHMVTIGAFLRIWKTCPYPHSLSSSDLPCSQSRCCAGSFPKVVRLITYPRLVLLFFRLLQLHRRRHGKCVGGPNTVSSMMQLSDGSCGELQIAKQKDGIAHCRAASLYTPIAFCCEAGARPDIVIPTRFEVKQYNELATTARSYRPLRRKHYVFAD